MTSLLRIRQRMSYFWQEYLTLDLDVYQRDIREEAPYKRKYLFEKKVWVLHFSKLSPNRPAMEFANT